MSVVGPRPALPNEVATYNDYQRQRLLVKPGMTCYWQTRRNRDSITFDEWVDLDLWVGRGLPPSMIEFDIQIVSMARAMSFLFSGRVQLLRCAKNCTLPRDERPFLHLVAICEGCSFSWVRLSLSFGQVYRLDGDFRAHGEKVAPDRI